MDRFGVHDHFIFIANKVRFETFEQRSEVKEMWKCSLENNSDQYLPQLPHVIRVHGYKQKTFDIQYHSPNSYVLFSPFPVITYPESMLSAVGLNISVYLY